MEDRRKLYTTQTDSVELKLKMILDKNLSILSQGIGFLIIFIGYLVFHCV